MALEIPKSPKPSRFGDAPKRTEPKPKNLNKNPQHKPVAMTFLVEEEFRTNYKIYSAKLGMKMVEVFRASFDVYKKQNH